MKDVVFYKMLNNKGHYDSQPDKVFTTFKALKYAVENHYTCFYYKTNTGTPMYITLCNGTKEVRINGEVFTYHKMQIGNRRKK